MSDRILLSELETYLWNSAVILRTNIDAGAYKQYIFPLLFFKRICDVYDEECRQILIDYEGDEEALDWEENHRFIVPKGYHWNDVRKIPENVGKAILDAFQAIESANIDKLQGVFGDGSWTNKRRLPDELLKNLVEHFSTRTLSLANCPEDELGQGYEYLIKKFADDSGHTAQEFYTNRTVVHLMTELLQPQSGESVYEILTTSLIQPYPVQRNWQQTGYKRILLATETAKAAFFMDIKKPPIFSTGGAMLRLESRYHF